MLTIDELFEAYAHDLNAHADQCDACAASRKCSDTRGCCDAGRKIVDTFKESVWKIQQEEFRAMKKAVIDAGVERVQKD